MNTVLVEKYQYTLLLVLLTDNKFLKRYKDFLIRYNKILFSNKFLRNLFIIIVKRLQKPSIETLTNYINQAVLEGKIDVDEGDLYLSFINRIQESKEEIPDFLQNFVSFISERLVSEFKNDISSLSNPIQILEVLKKYQQDFVGLLSIFDSEEEPIESLVEELKGLHSDLFIPFNLSIDSCPGVRQYELCIIGAATGIGKSWFLLHSFWQSLLSNKRCLFISLEMSKAQLYDRLLMLYTGKAISRKVISYTDDLLSIKTHVLEPIESLERSVVEFEDFIKEKKCRFVFHGLAKAERSLFYSDNILTEINKYEMDFGELPQVLVVDGIEFMHYPSSKQLDPWLRESLCVLHIKELSKSLGLASIINSHVMKNKRSVWIYPQDLSGGADKARVADVVLTLSATADELHYSVRRLLVAKNRMNPTGAKYWFPVVPQKNVIIPTITNYDKDLEPNLDAALAKLSTDTSFVNYAVEDNLALDDESLPF